MNTHNDDRVGSNRDDGAGRDEVTFEAVLRAVIFQGNDSTYVVGRFDVADDLFPIVANGDMVAPSVGDTYRLTGAWVQHPKYGRQFRWSAYELVYPQTAEGIERYLSSGLIHGLGKTFARRIVKRFGTQTIDILNTDIERLLEVEGIGPKKLDVIRAAWDEQRGVQTVMLFLREHTVGTAHAARIFACYGHAAVDMIRMNPYRLVDDIDGIGFVTADAIARSLGVTASDPVRLAAGVLHALNEAARSAGHVYVPFDELAAGAAQLLEADHDDVVHAINRAAEKGVLVLDHDRVYAPLLHAAECAVTAGIERLDARGAHTLDHAEVNTLIGMAEQHFALRFAPAQAEAIHTCLGGPVVILTGGPGTGKTTTVGGIIDVAERLQLRVVLCAPTGRAARRMSWLSGREARTIHRLLEFDPMSSTFQRDDAYPIEADLVIVDETSMVDIQLMAALLSALPADARLVLVGDADQLPSVGPGIVLADLIACDRIGLVRLTVIFRQEEASRLVTNAHRMRSGFMPVFERDTFLLDCDHAETIAQRIREVVAERLPREMGFDPVKDIQVMAPMHATPAGVRNLNAILQEALNPSGRIVLRRGERIWRLGDKVMQLRNNYDKDVFNGDIGFITALDDEEALIDIRFDDRQVAFTFDEMDDLVHAYAITIHKSQGSEYTVVVLPLTMQHRIMLQRNLVYTAMTRARRLIVFVGQRKALEYAVANDRRSTRYSALQERLRLR